MSIVNNITADFWIVKNHPKNGVYRVYYKKGMSGWSGDVTLDPEEGEGLRYEWYYKDGKRADGISKGWYKNGTLRHVMHWKDNMKNGLEVEYFIKGHVRTTGMYRNEKQYGNWVTFSPDGSQYSVVTYDKFGRKNGILREWYDNNRLRLIEHWKEDKRHGKHIHFYEAGGVSLIENYKNGKREGLSKSWSPGGKENARWINEHGSPYTGHKIIWWQTGERKLDEIYKNGENVCHL